MPNTTSIKYNTHDTFPPVRRSSALSTSPATAQVSDKKDSVFFTFSSELYNFGRSCLDTPTLYGLIGTGRTRSKRIGCIDPFPDHLNIPKRLFLFLLDISLSMRIAKCRLDRFTAFFPIMCHHVLPGRTREKQTDQSYCNNPSAHHTAQRWRR